MKIETIQLPEDGSSKWAGMGDFLLVSPDQKHQVQSFYDGEPPHGDSIQRLVIDGRDFLGWAWGCLFAFSRCSRYFVFSGMRKKLERLTIVVDVESHKYFVLPDYIHAFRVDWPLIKKQASNLIRSSISSKAMSYGKRTEFNSSFHTDA